MRSVIWDLPFTTSDAVTAKLLIRGKNLWCIGNSTHIKETLAKAEKILSTLYSIKGFKIKVKTKKCKMIPILADLHPEMDKSDLLDEDLHSIYQHLIGIYSGYLRLRGLIFSSLSAHSANSPFVPERSS